MTATGITLPDFEEDKGAPLEPPPAPPIEPELPPRSPRQRRRTTKPPEPAQVTTPKPAVSEEDKAALAGILTAGVGIVFEIIATQRGDHWKVDREEASRVANAWAEPLAPVLAENSKYVPWAVAILATFSVVSPRLAKDSDKLAKADTVDAKVT